MEDELLEDEVIREMDRIEEDSEDTEDDGDDWRGYEADFSVTLFLLLAF